VIEFPGLDVTDPKQNPYYASSDVLATVDGSPVTPATAVVSPNRYEIRYVDAVADFCASGIPSPAAVTTLTNQYGRQAPARRCAASRAPTGSTAASRVPCATTASTAGGR